MPRIVLSEFNTHRAFSRNSASSRAIPTFSMVRAVLEDPFIPANFGTDRPGMQSGVALEGELAELATSVWLRARDQAVASALSLMVGPDLVFEALGSDPGGALLLDRLPLVEELARSRPKQGFLRVHKEIANRLLETFAWHRVIVTATDWGNFIALRAHPDAQPEIAGVAIAMRNALNQSVPTKLTYGEWHLPLVSQDELAELETGIQIQLSVARCARVSYLSHRGVRDLEADVRLYDRLLASRHMSPFEHVARPLTPSELEKGPRTGNFEGWIQHRKAILFESDYGHVLNLREGGF